MIGPGGRSARRSRQASGQVEGDLDLVEQHLEAGMAVAGLAGDDLGRELAVGQVGIVPAQVPVDARRTGDGAAHAVLADGLGGQDPDTARPREEDLVAGDQVLDVGEAAAHVGDGLAGAGHPALGDLLLQAAHAVEHVVHPPAGDLLHHGLEGLALAEGVEERGDRAQFEGVAPQEHQVVEHPVQLGQQGAGPDGADGDLHAEHAFDRDDHAQFIREGREPVVAVGQDDDLPVVTDLEELLRAPVHVADDRFGRADAFAVEGEAEPQDSVGRRVLRADVEDHVLGREFLGARAHADHDLAHGAIVPCRY